jgi:Autoinducer binding domain
MNTSRNEADDARSGPGTSLGERVSRPDYAARVCASVAEVAKAPETASLLAAMKQAVQELGAEGGVFTSAVRDDAANSSYRSLIACDPRWASTYAQKTMVLDDPWIFSALCSSVPVLGSELKLLSTKQAAVCVEAAQFGFASCIVVPAPSHAGRARQAALTLGSSVAGYFEDEAVGLLKILACGLAMELNHWCFRQTRDELLAKFNMTAAELELLGHEQLGHSSKVIAAALNTRATTIDCRFQRLSGRLGMANRRDAVRYAELYGLIPLRRG